jgi:hypothetical protein
MLPGARPVGCRETGAGGFACGEAGFGCGAVSCCVTAGAADGAIAEMPAASSSRKRCARVVAGVEVVAGAAAADDVVTALSGRGSNVVRDPFEFDATEVVAAVVDDAADSVAVFTVYERTRTMTAVANATVRSVRKTERNEIWSRRRTRNLQLTTPGTARVKGSISARNVSPFGSFIVYAPCIDPIDVRNGQKLVYSNVCPGFNTGDSPITPAPCTRSMFPSESVMIHSRLMSCAVSLPSFEITTW